MKHLARDLGPQLRLGRHVRKIAWQRGRVRLETRSIAGAVSIVEARAAIVTVPIGVLDAPARSPGGIAFEPEPARARQALRRLASGSVVRLVLRFHEPPWTLGSRGADEEEAWSLGFLQMADGPFQVCWTAHPGRVPMAIAWSGGPAAAALGKSGKERIVTAALAHLAKALGTRQPRLAARLRGSWWHDWDRDPFSRGAYSYVRVGGAEAGRQLAQPFERTLFFAGEATAEASGTVEGALASGLTAARQVASALTATRAKRRGRLVSPR